MSVARVVRYAVLVALVLGAVTAAQALDRTIPGAKLRLKRSPSGREVLLFTSKQPGFPLEDPTVVGARVELFSANGGYAAFDVPAGLGNPGWYVNPNVQLYKFRNNGAPGGPSPLRLLVLQNGKQIKISGKSAGLTPGGLGAVGIRITTGAYRNCALFAFGRAIVQKDTAAEFSARDASASPALPSCSPQVLGNAICGNGVLEADETCDGAADAACPGLCNADCTCPPPVCGDQRVNQASEACDGSDDAACPGQCQPTCVCLGVCGDGIVNQPSENCDGPGSCTDMASFDCRAPGTSGECSCCSTTGFFCGDIGCCGGRVCTPGPHFSGTCCSPVAYPCQQSSECCAFLTCSGGVCCGPANYPCGNGTACCSGTCAGGFCAP